MSEFNDFIYINSEALSKEKCEEIVDYVEKNKKTFEQLSAIQVQQYKEEGVLKNKFDQDT